MNASITKGASRSRRSSRSAASLVAGDVRGAQGVQQLAPDRDLPVVGQRQHGASQGRDREPVFRDPQRRDAHVR